MNQHYKVVSNRQEQLKNVVKNFKFDGPLDFLLLRYYVMSLMTRNIEASADKNGDGQEIPNEIKAMFDTSMFAREVLEDAKEMFISEDNADDTKDSDAQYTIEYDGTIAEFNDELHEDVLCTMSSAFEHEFLDFSEATGIGRMTFECRVAELMDNLRNEGLTAQDFLAIETQD